MLREAARIACGPQRVPPWYEVLKSYGTGSTATRLVSNAECSGSRPAKLYGRPHAGVGLMRARFSDAVPRLSGAADGVAGRSKARQIAGRRGKAQGPGRSGRGLRGETG